jgi:hypothetical protein
VKWNARQPIDSRASTASVEAASVGRSPARPVGHPNCQGASASTTVCPSAVISPGAAAAAANRCGTTIEPGSEYASACSASIVSGVWAFAPASSRSTIRRCRKPGAGKSWSTG